MLTKEKLGSWGPTSISFDVGAVLSGCECDSVSISALLDGNVSLMNLADILLILPTRRLCQLPKRNFSSCLRNLL